MLDPDLPEGRQEEIITTMLRRYDDRLAEFAQTLNDALAQPLPERISAAITGAPTRELNDHGVLRLLEIARERTSADAAVAVLADPKAEPMLATVGLSQAEVAQVERLGIPEDELAEVASATAQRPGAKANPRRVTAAEVETLLRSIY
jgi:alcohol dehydrogenase class IV